MFKLETHQGLDPGVQANLNRLAEEFAQEQSLSRNRNIGGCNQQKDAMPEVEYSQYSVRKERKSTRALLVPPVGESRCCIWRIIHRFWILARLVARSLLSAFILSSCLFDSSVCLFSSLIFHACCFSISTVPLNAESNQRHQDGRHCESVAPFSGIGDFSEDAEVFCVIKSQKCYCYR
jgi:hypothetical protein